MRLCKISRLRPLYLTHFFLVFQKISTPDIQILFMLNRKLLEVLSRFTAAEKKRWRLFLLSPYFNPAIQAKMLIRLSDYILKYGAVETHPRLDKAVVFAHFFPGNSFQEGKKNGLDGLMSRLFNLVRTFLALEEQERYPDKAEHRGWFAWLQFCRKQGLEDRFWQGVDMLRQIHEQWPTGDIPYYRSQFELADEIAAFKTLTNRFEDDAHIGAASAYLDVYYTILQLERVCAALYQQQLMQGDGAHDPAIIDYILLLARKGGFDQLPIIQLYRLIYEILSAPDDTDLHHAFESLLEQSQHTFSRDTLHNLKAYQRLFWVRHYTKSGDPFHRQKLFELYKDHFEHGYFYVDGNITLAALRMLTVFALKLGQFDWVKAVLEHHPASRICGTRYPVEAYNLNVAEYHFYKKEYAQALQKLQYRLFENPHFSLLVDVLLIKIYMETGHELLESRMTALDRKVRRMRLSTTAKGRYVNFLKKLDKINRHVWPKNSTRYEKMVQELKSIPLLLEREWLVDMLEKTAK